MKVNQPLGVVGCDIDFIRSVDDLVAAKYPLSRLSFVSRDGVEFCLVESSQGDTTRGVLGLDTALARSLEARVAAR